MAMKYYCDGCDAVVAYDLIQHVTTRVEIRGNVSSAGGQYELCGYCAKKLAGNCNPKSWVRERPAAAE